MHTIDAIRARRAVKQFDPTQIMRAADEAALRDAVRQAPTSFNIQNWRIVTVKDTDLRTQIRAAAWNQAQVTDASLLLVLCADLQAWDKKPERYSETATKEVSDWLVNAIREFYRGRDWQQRDEAMRSVGIVAQTLMLATKALGYESCPMIGFDAAVVGKLINLPKDHVVGMIVAIGKGVAAPMARGGYLPESEMFIEDRFAG